MSVKFMLFRKSSYYYRRRIPNRLRKRFGQAEIKLSLHTGDKHLAHYRASAINLIVLPFINQAKIDERISMSDLKDLIGRVATWTSITLPSGVELKSDKSNQEAEREQLLALMYELKALAPELIGSTSAATPEKYVSSHSPPIEQSHHTTHQTISQVFKELERDRTDSRMSNWKPATVLDYQDTCQLYLEHIGGDKPVSAIRVNDHLDFKNTLRKVPSNRSKKAQYRNRNIRELLDMDIPEKDLMSFRTINNHITRINAVMNWLRDERKADLPAIKKLEASKDIQDRDARGVFTKEELKKLFNHPNYLKHSFLHDYFFWLIPLGLYTGCRLRELCQIETNDVQMCPVTKIWYIDINSNISPELVDTGVIKSLKTKSAKRQIPIHSHLMELGFISFVDSRRTASQSKFIFDLKPNGAGDISVSASKWFQRYRKNFTFDLSNGRKDFHSLRHTFIDKLFDEDVREVINKDLVGHAHATVTTSVYRKNAKLEKLKEGLETIDYRDVMKTVRPWTHTS